MLVDRPVRKRVQAPKPVCVHQWETKKIKDEASIMNWMKSNNLVLRRPPYLIAQKCKKCKEYKP